MIPARRQAWVQVSLALMIFLAACRGRPTPEPATATNPPPASSNTPAQPAEPTPDLSILYEDDFSDADSGWPAVTLQGGVASYQNPEVYRLEINTPGIVLQASRSGAFADFSAEVVADFAGGIGEWHSGLIFRQVTPDNYYAFVISPSRQVWKALKRSLGQWEVLAEGISTAISSTGGAQNTLRVDASGANLTLSVNGTGVVSLTDDSFAAGDIGLIAETVDERTAVMNADSIVVRRFDAAAVPAAPTAAPILATETTTPTETATPSPSAVRSPVPPTANLLTALPNSATALAATAQSAIQTAAALASQIPPIATLACGLPGLPACP
jgi:hypothetical protein